MTKRPSGMTYNTMCGTGKNIDDAKAILTIVPGLNFAIAEVPSREHMNAQEDILGFKWTLLEEKKKEKTMRPMDEIEQELENVEWGLRIAAWGNEYRKVKENCWDALK